MSLKGRSCWVVNIRMDDAEKLSLEAIGRFVEASEELRFEGENRQQVYGWVERVLVQQEFAQQGKAARGLVRRYVEKMTGMSRAQVTRLIARYTATGQVRPTIYRRRRFPGLYTRADVELLASVDEAHETLSGPDVYKRQHMHIRARRFVVGVPFFVLDDEMYGQVSHDWVRARLDRYGSGNEGGNVFCESDTAHEA